MDDDLSEKNVPVNQPKPLSAPHKRTPGVSGFPRPMGGPAPSMPGEPALAPASLPSALYTGEVVIRTMHDDIADVKAGKTPSHLTTAAPVRPVPANGAPTAPAPAVFPLPPTATGAQQKVVLAPTLARRPRRRWGRLGGGVFFLLLLGAAVAGAWWWFTRTAPGGPGRQPAPVGIAAVLPADYLLVAQYRFDSVESRTEVATAWAVRGELPTTAAMLAGDPRPLLTDAALTEMYYVFLPESASPYLVVPKTPATTELLVARGEARVVEKDGWYIAHQLATEPYTAALATQSLASIGAPPLLTDESVVALMRLYLGAGWLPTLRQDVAGESFLGGQLQELQLAVRRQGSGALALAGRAVTPVVLTELATNQQLLSLVPAEATMVRLGANFAEDLEHWRAVAGVLDEAALKRPVVAQQLAHLTSPYAFFTFPQAETFAFGLIIELPRALQGTITLEEHALAEGVPALLPLLLDRRTVAPLAFTTVPYDGGQLRFANIVGTAQALDYAVTPTHLLIATSKDSMLALLDTVAGGHDAVTSAGAWASVLETWGALPTARDVVLGQLTLPALRSLLPVAATDGGLPFGLLLQGDPVQAKVSGVIELPVAAQPTPVTSPLATPRP